MKGTLVIQSHCCLNRWIRDCWVVEFIKQPFDFSTTPLPLQFSDISPSCLFSLCSMYSIRKCCVAMGNSCVPFLVMPITGHTKTGTWHHRQLRTRRVLILYTVCRNNTLSGSWLEFSAFIWTLKDCSKMTLKNPEAKNKQTNKPQNKNKTLLNSPRVRE